MSVAACAALVERGDPDRFRAIMAAPVAARDVLFPIHAFTLEVARAPWVTQEAMIAEMRLQWWRDALAEIASGKTVRRHEVVTPLAGVLSPESARMLDQTVQARRWDIYRDAFEDSGHLDDYIDRTAAHPMVAAARALGPCDEGAVRDHGYAAGLANFLVAVPRLAAAGRVPLLDGRDDAVAALAGAALARLHAGRAGLPAISRPARAALLPGWQAEALLRRAVHAPRRVAEGQLELGPWGKSWRLARAAIRGQI